MAVTGARRRRCGQRFGRGALAAAALVYGRGGVREVLDDASAEMPVLLGRRRHPVGHDEGPVHVLSLVPCLDATALEPERSAVNLFDLR